MTGCKWVACFSIEEPHTRVICRMGMEHQEVSASTRETEVTSYLYTVFGQCIANRNRELGIRGHYKISLSWLNEFHLRSRISM